MKQLIVEAMVTPKQAEYLGMALFVSPQWYVLYRNIDAESTNSIRMQLMTSIVGVLRLSSIDRSMIDKPIQSVLGSYAEKGYGPLLYDAALSMGNFLTPDRAHVSTQASNVWQKYLTRSDVQSIELPQNFRAHPQQPWLDRAYYSTAIQPPTELIDMHEQNKKQFGNSFDKEVQQAGRLYLPSRP